VRVIHNAVDPERFTDPDPRYRAKLLRYYRPRRTLVVGAAGRLSPEKGFDVLVRAAEQVAHEDASVGFILFGEGPCRAQLVQQINAAGLKASFVLSGFRADLDRFVPHLDLLVLPSHTEGLPNVVLEACAAAVPVVATAVGGTPEVIEDGVSGYLVRPGDPEALAGRIRDLLAAEELRREMGFQGRQRVLEHFTFAAQAEQYRELLAELTRSETGAAEESAARLGSAAEPAPDESRPGDLIPTETTCAT
jgi:glycosyltransferase involved in cell wall biosynthesis